MTLQEEMSPQHDPNLDPQMFANTFETSAGTGSSGQTSSDHAMPPVTSPYIDNQQQRIDNDILTGDLSKIWDNTLLGLASRYTIEEITETINSSHPGLVDFPVQEFQRRLDWARQRMQRVPYVRPGDKVWHVMEHIQEADPSKAVWFSRYRGFFLTKDAAVNHMQCLVLAGSVPKGYESSRQFVERVETSNVREDFGRPGGVTLGEGFQYCMTEGDRKRSIWCWEEGLPYGLQFGQ